MKKIISVGLILVIFATALFAEKVTRDQAVLASHTAYVLQLRSSLTKLSFDQKVERIKKLDNYTVQAISTGMNLVEAESTEDIFAYVVTYEDGAYVMVSSEKRMEPILAQSLYGPFNWDNLKQSYLGDVYLKDNYKPLYEEVRKQPETREGEMHEKWTSLYEMYTVLLEKSKVSYEELLTADITDSRSAPFDGPDVELGVGIRWSQRGDYNDTVVAANGNNEVPAGCVAIAMAIKMRYHEWPYRGEGSKSYRDSSGSIKYSHYADYSSHTYDWDDMPLDLDDPNDEVADLIYHCGVAVSMNYEKDESSAYTDKIQRRLVDSFYYTGGIDGTTSESQIVQSLRAEIPVVARYDGHAWVIMGYRASSTLPNYAVNLGWGDGNTWVNLDNVHEGNKMLAAFPFCHPDSSLYVNVNYSGTSRGTVTHPYKTLDYGRTKVKYDGKLYMKKGTYNQYSTIILGTEYSNKYLLKPYSGTVNIVAK